jgi:hypothetical protein
MYTVVIIIHLSLIFLLILCNHSYNHRIYDQDAHDITEGGKGV